MVIENAQPFDVLLVEDEPADANLVRVALKESRILCRLHHLSDGVEALAFLRREGELYRTAPRPDLILLDLNMQRMNGQELLRIIKDDLALNTIPVVILTTSDVERDVVASYQLGAAGYVTKPVDIEQFIEAIRQIGRYWFVLVLLPTKDPSV